MANSQQKARARAAAFQGQTPIDDKTLLRQERRKYNELVCANAKLSAEFDMVSIEDEKNKVIGNSTTIPPHLELCKINLWHSTNQAKLT